MHEGGGTDRNGTAGLLGSLGHVAVGGYTFGVGRKTCIISGANGLSADGMLSMSMNSCTLMLGRKDLSSDAYLLHLWFGCRANCRGGSVMLREAWVFRGMGYLVVRRRTRILCSDGRNIGCWHAVKMIKRLHASA